MASKSPRNLDPIARIVVGVDGEGLSDAAVQAGLELGERLDARVGLVHAVPKVPELWPGLDPLASQERSEKPLQAARRSIAERVGKLVRASRGASAKLDEILIVIPGRAGEVIVEQARTPPPALILLGARHHHGLLHFGGTMRTALAKGPDGVWVQASKPKPLRTILAPVDLSEPSLEALSAACALAKAYSARVRALYVFDAAFLGGDVWSGLGSEAVQPILEVRRKAQEHFERRMQEFDWLGLDHETQFDEGHPTQRILEHGRASDLVVLGTHGHGGLAAVLLGSTAWSVLLSSEKPVLVVRPKASQAAR